jgi:hypothetical protein
LPNKEEISDNQKGHTALAGLWPPWLNVVLDIAGTIESAFLQPALSDFSSFAYELAAHVGLNLYTNPLKTSQNLKPEFKPEFSKNLKPKGDWLASS